MPDVHVRAQALLGALARRGGHVQQRSGGGRHVLALPVNLVGPVAEHLVERLPGHRHRVGVRDPRAVEAALGLALLVLAHRLEGLLVGLLVSPRRDHRGHAAHRVGPAGVARLHDEVAVGLHERDGHRHAGPVRRHELGARAEPLDHREDVVPAAGVQAGGVVAHSYRIASMQNAAGIVSIRTVALIVPRSSPSVSSAITNASRQSAASCCDSSFGM